MRLGVRLEAFHCRANFATLNSARCTFAVGITAPITGERLAAKHYVLKITNYKYKEVDIVNDFNTFMQNDAGHSLRLGFNSSSNMFYLYSGVVGATFYVVNNASRDPEVPDRAVPIGLWEALGFTGGVEYKVEGAALSALSLPYEANICPARAKPDLIGTRFIAITSSLGISNVDPVTLNLTPLLAVIPVDETDLFEGRVNYSASTSAPFYYTLNERRVDTISLEFGDDLGNTPDLTGNWLVVLSFAYCQPVDIPQYTRQDQLGRIDLIDSDGRSYAPNKRSRNIGDQEVDDML
jgi:hypothetical protein